MSTLLVFLLFADDTTLLFSSSDIVSKIPMINSELSEVSNWFKANKLSVNATKTNYMIMGTQHMTSMEDQSVSNIDIILDKTKLKRVDKTKFLGVTIDENLSWKNHTDGTTKTISRNKGMINKLKFIIPERIMRTLYCTLVLPYINYGILIWGRLAKHVQRKFINFKSGLLELYQIVIIAVILLLFSKNMIF